jgi:16S rRNA (guanine966-N2)-methyltransferase
MRVVAGQFRGRKLIAPADGTTRPTTDKVREAVFNALTSLDAIVDARVADLYAGSGALGIEALSRGAAHCTFVERGRFALSAVEANLAALGLRDRARVVAGDARTVVPQLDAQLVFADPPYGFDDWTRLLAAMPGDVRLVVAEAAAPVAAPDGWSEARVKRYGRTWVTFLEPATLPG